MNQRYALQYIHSPVGQLRLIADEQYLIGVLWRNETIRRFSQFEYCEVAYHPILEQATQQLQQYFAQQRQNFDLPISIQGTNFQIDVWNALKTIPYGETRSYQDIAQQIGRPKAVRAVGMTNGQNPLSIIIPCHRVIGKNGKMVGFGGGIKHKITLLEIEANAIQC